MAISLGSLVVELLAKTASFQSGMSKASYEGRKAAKEIQSSFKGMGDKLSGRLNGALSSLGEFGSVIGELSSIVGEAFDGIGKSSNGIAQAATALGGLAAAGIAVAAGLSLMAKEGAEVTERLSQISQKTGISTHDLQVLEAAGQSVGLSLDDMVIGFRKFDQAITGNGRHAGAATSVLKQLGITARDNREALLQAADAFKGMEDGPKKAADAVALFGKSGLNMIPFLNKGRNGILEFEDAVDTFGPKITKQGIENTEAWKVSVEKLSLSWQNMAVTISDQVLPALTKTTTAIAGLVRGASVITGASLTAIGALLHGENVGGAIAMYLGERTDEGGTQAELQSLQRSAPIDTSKGVEALFGPQTKHPLEGAPDLGSHIFADITHAMDGLTKDLTLGKNALDDFYGNWDRQARGTVESINKAYDQQLAHFQGLLALGQISAEQATDVYDKIQRQREETLKGLRQATGTSTFRDAWQDMFTEIAASGRDFARSITADIGAAIEHLNQSLAQFVATGKGINFKQIGQSLEANLFSSVLKKGESSLFGSLGNLFGLGNSTKPDGSSQSAALWVQMATANPLGAAAGIGALPLGNLNGVASLLGGSGLNIGKIVGGIGTAREGFFILIAALCCEVCA